MSRVPRRPSLCYVFLGWKVDDETKRLCLRLLETATLLPLYGGGAGRDLCHVCIKTSCDRAVRTPSCFLFYGLLRA